MDVIQGAANILAACINIPLERNKEKVAEIAKIMKPMKFSKQKLEVDEK